MTTSWAILTRSSPRRSRCQFTEEVEQGGGPYLRETTKFKCASAIYQGPLNKIGDAWGAFVSGAMQKGEPTGESRELFLYYDRGIAQQHRRTTDGTEIAPASKRFAFPESAGSSAVEQALHRAMSKLSHLRFVALTGALMFTGCVHPRSWVRPSAVRLTGAEAIRIAEQAAVHRGLSSVATGSQWRVIITIVGGCSSKVEIRSPKAITSQYL